ncbi:hypothetical protein [Shinella sp. CPCC 101442]|uniref:hypothetical protein n=1 Tax=Shinella sp. CPCC 101442 TaxID=2932265 RepID=UPI002152AD3F|nr:hypothetical protein [Shinella sp. CPCC 101442]
MTKSADIARKYQRLGGKRIAKIDDNIISTRMWEDEPAEASAFWKKNVAGLTDEEQAEVISNLEETTSTKS